MNILNRRGKLRFLEGRIALLITDEKMLDRIIEDPAQPLLPVREKGYSGELRAAYGPDVSLADLLEQGRAQDAACLEVSYDYFFGGSRRTCFPDSEKTVAAYEVISRMAAEAGMAFSASVVSPLDVGGGYARLHAEGGQTVQFEECAVDADGNFAADLPLQTQWYNNKGPARLRLMRVSAFAFDEERIGDTPYYAVDPDGIVNISADVRYEAHPERETISPAGYGSAPLRVYGRTACGKRRCLVTVRYATPELDYFSPDAYPYMQSILNLHQRHGIHYAGFYSDEMHIQFDWDLASHFGHESELRVRYLTNALAAAYARRYGAQYRDFEKYLVYFAYHRHDFLNGPEGKLPSQHVFGKDVRDVRATWLFRKRYYDLLQRRVVDLCCDTKNYAETLFGSEIWTSAHSTWQESPTCDRFGESDRFAGEKTAPVCRYDYLPAFQWSSSIRENMSACCDYFQWNEFLSGGGTDHPEGGQLDRCYYGAAFAAGLSAVNKVPMGYYGMWGSPKQLLTRLARVGTAYGLLSDGHTFLAHHLAQGLTVRQSDVLMLYPLDLNSVEERFGSWMVQYGYCDYCTEEQFIKRFRGINGAAVQVGERAYRAVCVLYAPLMANEALQALRAAAEQGARVIWCAAPAQTDAETERRWMELFGIAGLGFSHGGLAAQGERVRFQGRLGGIPPMVVPTDFLPDFLYPVTPAAAAEPCAFAGDRCVGVSREYPSGGLALFCGFRPRDDQSISQGADLHTLFDILCAAGAYGDGSFEKASRPEAAPYLLQAFPNGAVSITRHMRTVPETWYGSFYRDAEQDKAIVQVLALPPSAIDIDERIRGRRMEIQADGIVTYRLDGEGNLVSLAAERLRRFAVDGKPCRLMERTADIGWCRLEAAWLADGVAEAYAVISSEAGEFSLPSLRGDGWQAAYCGPHLFETRKPVPLARGGRALTIEETNRWYVVYRETADRRLVAWNG